MLPYWTALIPVLVAAPALAADSCRDPQTQGEMTRCAGEDYARADRELNAVYARVRAALPTEELERLKAAQRAWIVSRDADCELEPFGARGGSMEPMLAASCKADRTVQRTKWLRSLVEENPR